MFASIAKLVDRVIQLAEIRIRRDRALFDDFLTPTQNAFETVHADYLASFKRYREMIVSNKPALTRRHPLFSAIKQDILHTAGYRDRLRVVFESTRNKKSHKYLATIYKYLQHDNPIYRQEFIGARIGRNAAREECIEIIIPIFTTGHSPDLRRKRACEAIDKTVGKLQDRYTNVTRAYTDLKHQLLRINDR